ncbi:general transcription factor II-I repeat domain-containing protein 2A, partial [Notothenia coriiceps]|uniref:General transcription factor II-I repeat domain-containing protein 2A n=1 Tax=Notothenia coriiceps TaxID=8208 RepID=A0A6I9NAA0_9TELE
DELASDVESQLKTKAKDFISYSLAVDESTDRTDTAQLSIFIRGVDSQLSVTEELLDVKPIHGTTTGKDIFTQVEQSVNKMELPWSKLVGLTTDGAPAMCGEVRGLVGLTRKAMGDTGENLVVYHCIIHQEALCGKVLGMEHVMTVVTKTVNFIRARGLNHRQFRALLEEENSVQEDLPYHTEVRWLSRGKVLRRFYDTRTEIARFMESKQRPVPELENEKWLGDLAFMCDITEHLNSLNVKLQGRKQLITEMWDSVKAFELKLRLWEGQMRRGNLTHFPTCQTISATVTIPRPTQVYADKLNTLKEEFSRRFADFESQKFNIDLFANPFAIDVDTAPEHLQLELIELQCNSALKTQYQSVGAAEFAPLLPESVPELRLHAANIMSMFGSTYSCEQMFSIMNLNKTSHRSRITDQHLTSVLKVATAKDIKPRIDKIICKKRCRVSGKS